MEISRERPAGPVIRDGRPYFFWLEVVPKPYKADKPQITSKDPPQADGVLKDFNKSQIPSLDILFDFFNVFVGHGTRDQSEEYR